MDLVLLDLVDGDASLEELGLLAMGHETATDMTTRFTMALLRMMTNAPTLPVPILAISATALADTPRPRAPLATARLTILDRFRRMVPAAAQSMGPDPAFDTSSGPTLVPFSTLGPAVEAWTTSWRLGTPPMPPAAGARDSGWPLNQSTPLALRL